MVIIKFNVKMPFSHLWSKRGTFMTELIEMSGIHCGVITNRTVMIDSVANALDLMMTFRYNSDCDRIAINKEAFAEDFFVLSTGIAGDILRNFVNYQMKIAIWGDFSNYTSKPLKKFIRESNQGKDVFFLDTKVDAIEKLMSV